MIGGEGWGGRRGWGASSDRPGLCTSQLIRPINALDELCRLMKSLVHPKSGAAGSLGAGLIPISSELCYRLGACQIAMCGTGMQRCGGGVAGPLGVGPSVGGVAGRGLGVPLGVGAPRWETGGLLRNLVLPFPVEPRQGQGPLLASVCPL